MEYEMGRRIGEISECKTWCWLAFHVDKGMVYIVL